MKLFLNSFFALLLLVAMPASAAPKALEKPKVIALYFYADWCAICKELTPKIGQARLKGLDEKPVLFVTMNLTSKTFIHQSLLLAERLGVGAYVQSQGSATGYLALLNANTNAELARVGQGDTPETIEKKIDDALAAVK